MYDIIKNRRRRLRSLLRYKWFLKSFYGSRLLDYPPGVIVRLLLARLAYLLQLLLLLPGKRFLVRYHGARIYLDLTSDPCTLDHALGVYEYWTTRLIVDLVKEGMTIMDIGAWEGNYSILCARLMHDRGRVLAFEPEPELCDRIRKNIEVNKYECIEVHQCALSDREGNATFFTGGGAGSIVSRPLFLAVHQSQPIVVQTQTLDAVLHNLRIDKVDLIKIDVEGSDLLVLKGAQHTLREKNVKIVMDVDVYSDAERQELFDLLTSCGFALHRIDKRLTPIKTANDLFISPMRPYVRDIYAIKQ